MFCRLAADAHGLGRTVQPFLHGIEDDAREVIGELGRYLAGGSQVRGGRETARS